MQKINRVIRRSLEFANANPDSSHDFIKANAQEMNEEVMLKHIGLYVNEFTLELGEKGSGAVSKLLEIARQKNLIS